MTTGRWVVLTVIVLASLAGLWFGLGQKAPARLDRQAWTAYQSRFVTEDGRVLDRDTDPAGITHTEGQGYGMLLAEAAGDKESFERLWTWTRGHLRRPDGLFSWRWQDGRVADRNNATDGDILIAWALLRAGKDWHRDDWRRESKAIADVLLQRDIVRFGVYTLLLPADDGFQDEQGVVVNLSYWLFPAFRDFSQAFGSPEWSALVASGEQLLRQARFGTWQLPPDWLRIDGSGLRPAAGFDPRYAFNAVRVPLHLVWGNKTPPDDILDPFRRFWHDKAQAGQIPAWVDLTSGETAPYAWQTGMRAVAALADPTVGAPPPPGDKDGYFSWSLTLLSELAAAETPQ
jgi:endoglucanase